MSEARFAAALLAAGLSSRMAGPNKLLQDYKGRALVAYGADAVSACVAPIKIFVTGRDADAVAEAAGLNDAWFRTHNEAPQDGLSSSLKCAIHAAADADALAIVLGDMPGVSVALIDALFGAWTSDAYAVVPRIKGAMGNPVILSRAAMRDCLGLSGDKGARALIEQNAARVIFVETNDPGILRDFDTIEDFSASAD